MAYPFRPMTTRELLILSGEIESQRDSLVSSGSFATGDQKVNEKPSIKLLPLKNPLSSEESPKYLPTWLRID
jgi:hypothetical protein